MKRVMLYLEDYNEEMFIETLLKKISFDVLTVRIKTKLEDELLGFSPNVVISTGDGLKINGNKVALKVRKKGATTKLILLFPHSKIQDQNYISRFNFDNVLETPINPRTLIRTICELCTLNAEVFLSKFDKLPISQQGAWANNTVGNEVTAKKEKRMQKYKEILSKEENPKDQGFKRESVLSEVEEIRKYEKDHPELKELDEARKQFVVSLYKK